MHRFRARMLLWSGVVATLCLAGCPGQPALQDGAQNELGAVADTLLPGAADTVDELVAGAKDEVVYQALRTPVAASAAMSVDTAAEPATFVLSADTGAEPGIGLASIAMEVDGAGGVPLIHGRVVARYGPVASNNDPNAAGPIVGTWLAADGTATGHVVGHYHPTTPSNLPPGIVAGGVFHGRILNDANELIGHFRGRYGNGPNRPALFFGRWFSAADQLVGVLKGHWRTLPDVPGGQLFGRWAAFDLCNEIETLPAYPFDAGDVGGYEAADSPLPFSATRPEPVAVAAPLEATDGNEWPCLDPNEPRGLFRGFYHPHDPNAGEPVPGGILRARWMTLGGRVVGHLFGHYEPFADPEQDDPNAGQLLGRFYGRYLGPDGTFRGFVRGVYGTSSNGVGLLRGEYLDADTVPQGALLGRWRFAPQHVGGPLGGFWYGTDAGR